MNTETLCIKSITDAADLTAQQNIDADIILPDYYDTIGRILKSEITPVIEAVTVSGDKISIAGIAKFSMIFLGEDNKMYSYENEYKYTKVFQSQFAENCLTQDAKQTVFSVNCRAIAPKRIELRAVIQIKLKIFSQEEKSFLSSIDDSLINVKNETIAYISPVNTVSKCFSLSGSFPMSDFNDKIDIVIRKNSRVKITEIKTIHNKAYIKGLAESEISYYSDNTGNISSTALSIPISEIIDIFGAEDNDECEVFVKDIYTEVIIRNDSSASQALELRLDINMLASVSRNNNGNIITDLYSVSNEICKTTETAEVITSRKKITKTESIYFETDIYDESNYTIIDSWITDVKISTEKHSDKTDILATAIFNAVIRNENGNFSMISREHTFEGVLISESCAYVVKNLNTRVLSDSALQISGGKIRFSADISFECDICYIRKVTGFTDIKIDENNRTDRASSLSVYFAKQNEEIWTIAKENRTSVEKIKRINNLSGDFISEDIMLLLPSF